VLDIGPKETLKKAELWRQTVERTVFLYKSEPIDLTISGAVSIVVASGTYVAVLEQLEKIIKQAKDMGTNHLLFDNGKEIEPVKLPKMSGLDKEMVIQLDME
jgi:hypothetical protein